MIEALCARTHIARPRQVLLEMQMNAWVRLGGFRRGAGKVVLGLGSDLLAGLTRGELEAVLAHELSHAKVTRRAVRPWLSRGLDRAAQISRGLKARAAPRRGTGALVWPNIFRGSPTGWRNRRRIGSRPPRARRNSRPIAAGRSCAAARGRRRRS